MKSGVSLVFPREPYKANTTPFIRICVFSILPDVSHTRRAASSSHVLDHGSGASTNLPHFCIHGLSRWDIVIVSPWEVNKAEDPIFGYGIRGVSHAFEGMCVSESGEDAIALWIRSAVSAQFYPRGYWA